MMINVWCPFLRSLDEIPKNRQHSYSPSHYHDSHQEHRSVDSDYEYSEDRYHYSSSLMLQMHIYKCVCICEKTL